MFDISFANKIVKAYTDHCKELCTELAIPPEFYSYQLKNLYHSA